MNSDNLDELYQAQRKLKDRVRDKLGLPPRAKDAKPASLTQHAKNHNINPSWDLPLPEQVHHDGRHEDDIIQTLLLSHDMNKRLENLIKKNRSSQNERGIEVLFAVFGFLEWTPVSKDKKIMSPLVVLPVNIRKEKSHGNSRREGGKIPFWVGNRQDHGETNLFLKEKLIREEGIELPEFEGGSVESYFKEVEKVLQNTELNFQIRRQVSFGTFPSSLMAIYRDLKSALEKLRNSANVTKILTGANSSDSELQGSKLFAEDYPDSPEHEKAVPYLVMDADSSQFSALVDVMGGKNLALEGPPGTGKSQTIVNIIANAIVAGKKVLFIAEKQAALTVVHNRLQKLQLEKFILSLQARNMTRQQFVSLVKERLGIQEELFEFRSFEERDKDLDRTKKAREHIEKYIKIVSSDFGATGMTVHQILGKSIKLKATETLESGPKILQDSYISGVESWNKDNISEAMALAEKVFSADKQIRGVSELWRGAELKSVDPFTLKDILHATQNTAEACEATIEIAHELARYEIDAWDEKVCQTIDTLLAEAEEVAGLSQESEAGLSLLLSLCQAKNVEAVKLFSGKVAELAEREKEIEEILSEVLSAIEVSFRPKARYKVYLCRNLKLDSGKTAKALRTIAQVIFESKKYSFLFPQYRLAKLVARSLSDDGSFESQVAIEKLRALADKVESFYQNQEALNHDAEIREILGDEFFKGRATNFSQLNPFLSLIEQILLASDIKEVVLKILQNKNTTEVRAKLNTLKEAKILNQEQLENLSRQSGIDFFKKVAKTKLENVVEELKAAAQDRDGLEAHARYTEAQKVFSESKLAWVLNALQADGWPLEDLPKLLECLIYQSMVRRISRQYAPILSGFDYSSLVLNEKRAEFANTDRKIIKEAREYVRLILLQSSNPPPGNNSPRASERTELSLLRHEIGKRSGFRSPRELIHRAGAALLDLKPCWMMSPLAVAECLPQDMEFDLCVIDEASQMLPVYALGALMRSKQAVICGDVNQLPPSNFFRTNFTEEEDDEDIETPEESILELANTSYHPKRRLCWHYRSIYSALIAFCNRTVYQDSLIVFPSPEEVKDTPSDEEENPTDNKEKPVSLVFTNGEYGNSRNIIEAQVMVQHILEFMRKTPQHSLGVVVMNINQQEQLEAEWEVALNSNRDAQTYVKYWAEKNSGLEEFFIKNLENVQGDERDCIFIGTVYGPTEAGGKVAQRFGPINGEAGKRRLNVLFSRAKRKMVTFTSMHASDIINVETNPGKRMLKEWLHYSKTGELPALPKGPLPPGVGGEAESPFEEAVAEVIESLGYIAVPQVGSAGYKIDIGVIDPKNPDQYILAVECDGATYHSSRSARDRDRLRQEILEEKGWVFHRIWSTDWFLKRDEEIEKLHKAIEDQC